MRARLCVAARKGRNPRDEVAVTVSLDDDIELTFRLCHRDAIVGWNDRRVKGAEPGQKLALPGDAARRVASRTFAKALRDTSRRWTAEARPFSLTRALRSACPRRGRRPSQPPGLGPEAGRRIDDSLAAHEVVEVQQPTEVGPVVSLKGMGSSGVNISSSSPVCLMCIRWARDPDRPCP